MNIIQQHERVRYLLDRVASPRYDSEDIDNALNGEIEMIVNEKYDQTKPFNRMDAFQRTQRLRDELRNIVKKLGSGDTDYDDTNDLITVEATDYRYLLAMKIQFTGQGSTWYPCFPITYDGKNVVDRNPFRRVRSAPYPKVYYNEEDSKIKIIHPFGSDTFEDSEIYYLADPAIVNYGIAYDDEEVFADGTYVIAIEETVYAGATYVIGEKFQIVSPNFSITSGGVVAEFVETDLPNSLHEELCRRAASSILRTAKEYEKSNAILQGAVS